MNMHGGEYVIGTGYCPSDRYDYKAFANLWYNQIGKFTQPHHIYMVQQGNIWFPMGGPIFTKIQAENLGHVHQLIGQQQPARTNELCGWSASVMLLAMLAYNAEKDFVYVEQDCLIFGPIISGIIERGHRSNKDMLFGSCKIMGAAQSLFWVRHSFILTFIKEYLALWPDTDKKRRPEGKFIELESKFPSSVGRFPYGIDRDRPIPVEYLSKNNIIPWYVQQLTEAEITLLREHKLV